MKIVTIKAEEKGYRTLNKNERPVTSTDSSLYFPDSIITDQVLAQWTRKAMFWLINE